MARTDCSNDSKKSHHNLQATMSTLTRASRITVAETFLLLREARNVCARSALSSPRMSQKASPVSTLCFDKSLMCLVLLTQRRTLATGTAVQDFLPKCLRCGARIICLGLAAAFIALMSWSTRLPGRVPKQRLKEKRCVMATE